MSLSEETGYEPDPASVTGKAPPVHAQTDLLVIGAGPAGMAAALAAAEHGVQVTLVDEHPVPLRTMGEEVPLHFGGRMAATLGNRNAVLESVLQSHPQLAEASDAGIDVRLGTAVWGLFPHRPTTQWISGHVAGLADEEQAYLLRFKQVIVAAGRRDMGLAFTGWQLPGVMGASAAYQLACTYEGLQARTAVLLGSGDEALLIGNALQDAGVRIAAIVEQASTAVGATHLLERLRSQGARLFTSHVVQQALGDADGVAAVRLARIEADGHHDADELTTIECDALLLGVGAIPAIELLESSGCDIRFDAARGGHAPVLDAAQRTSIPFIYAVGDCAGIWSTKSQGSAIAAREGVIAARAAVRALGAPLADAPADSPVIPDVPARDIANERLAWVRATVLQAPADQMICQCEEVSAAEILALRPPRYLGWGKDFGPHGSAVSDPLGTHPDVVKRLTRAGMGACQGRRCREQITALLALGAGCALDALPLATYRVPVRPLRLDLLASLPEVPAMAAHWDSWFGMASQWVPFWRAPPQYTAAARGSNESVASE